MFTVADISEGFVNPLREGLARRTADDAALARGRRAQRGVAGGDPRGRASRRPTTRSSTHPRQPATIASKPSSTVRRCEPTGWWSPPRRSPWCRSATRSGRSDTPTFDDARGVDPICTRSPEPCPFHDRTLTDVVESGEPVALLISTPGFCQTAICGPVLELLMEARGKPTPKSASSTPRSTTTPRRSGPATTPA